MKNLTQEQKEYTAKANRWSIVLLIINLFFTSITVLLTTITLFYHYTNIESADMFPITIIWFLLNLLSILIGLITAYMSYKLIKVLDEFHLPQHRKPLLIINIVLGLIPLCSMFLVILLASLTI